MKSTVALFGGSFNPPHNAHVIATEYALSLEDVDEVWWMPVYQHAFAHKRHAVSFDERMAMCKIATETFGSQVQVKDIEREMGGTNRTIDTLRSLRTRHPDIQFRLMIGADIFEEAHLWKAFDQLEKEAPFIVLSRVGYPAPPGYDASPPLPDLSSSNVRMGIQSGDPYETSLPPGVSAYIASKGLYQGGIAS